MKTKIFLLLSSMVIFSLSSFTGTRSRPDGNQLFSSGNKNPIHQTQKTNSFSNSISSDNIFYTCGACGCPEDDSFFTKPGLCPTCKMPFIATYKNLRKTTMSMGDENTITKKVAVLIFDGVETIDYAGPVEVFTQAGMDVFTVAATADPVRSFGMEIIPTYTFDNSPKADILVLPGGNVNPYKDKPEYQEWIKKNAAQSEKVLSVCNGAFYLAASGLLDHQKATTFASLIPALQEEAPKATVISNERYADNGKIITSGGLASGIDGSLHVVQEYLGLGKTQEIATHLEYNWDPDGKYVRAALADKYVGTVCDVVQQFDNETLLYKGDRNQWQEKYLVKSDISSKDLLALLNAQMEQAEHWTKTGAKGNSTQWKIKTNSGENWTANISIDGAPAAWNVLMQVERAN